jgi:hypothetical protein
MKGAGLTCPSCAGNEVVRKQGRFACSFCGTRVVPRLEPGTLCADEGAAGYCTKPAESLCRYCARPLCDRHDAPKRLYWHDPLSWQRLCPRWEPSDAVQWGQVNGTLQGFPVADFAPFEWVPHDRRSQYEIGQLEEEILKQVAPVVRDAGGVVNDTACVFESLCTDCETELMEKVEEIVRGFGQRYAELAFRNRLEALHADTRQALRHVEAFLGRSIAGKIDEAEAEAHLSQLSVDAPRKEWDLWGHKLRARLEIIEALQGRLGGR